MGACPLERLRKGRPADDVVNEIVQGTFGNQFQGERELQALLEQLRLEPFGTISTSGKGSQSS